MHIAKEWANLKMLMTRNPVTDSLIVTGSFWWAADNARGYVYLRKVRIGKLNLLLKFTMNLEMFHKSLQKKKRAGHIMIQARASKGYQELRGWRVLQFRSTLPSTWQLEGDWIMGLSLACCRGTGSRWSKSLVV